MIFRSSSVTRDKSLVEDIACNPLAPKRHIYLALRDVDTEPCGQDEYVSAMEQGESLRLWQDFMTEVS